MFGTSRMVAVPDASTGRPIPWLTNHAKPMAPRFSRVDRYGRLPMSDGCVASGVTLMSM
jgi:hypothetical protein